MGLVPPAKFASQFASVAIFWRSIHAAESMRAEGHRDDGAEIAGRGLCTRSLKIFRLLG